jgi:hypothetical protein
VDRQERIHQEFIEDLTASEKCAERAVNAFSSEFAPRRSRFYRWRLKRAKNALTWLLAEEAYRQEKLGHL